jgi:hypothetical protein
MSGNDATFEFGYGIMPLIGDLGRRPLRMRLSSLTFLFAAMFAAGCGQSKAPEKLEAAVARRF